MNIYTKNGDKGKTSLIGGKIVSKHDLRVDSYGSIDELNSFLGLVRDYSSKKEINDILFKIQCKLFTIGSLLAQEKSIKNNSNEKLNINANDTEYLETKIDAFEKELPKLEKFIIPGGTKLVSYCHVSRAVCRRAERKISQLNELTEIDKNILTYINRLSDFLFVLARYFTKIQDVEESYW
jgi:cob(I)alamin adenosyltransferase